MSKNSRSVLQKFRLFQDLQLSIFRKFMLIFLSFLLIFILIYGLICAFLYFAQENLIFHPQKLASDFNFTKLFPNSIEINLKTLDNINLNGLFFATKSTDLNENSILQNSQSKLYPNYLPNLLNNSTEISQNLPQKSQIQNQTDLSNTTNSKGLVFYLHGNSGSIAGWGNIAKFYNKLGFDVLMPDYRGFGKSEGKIISQEQLFADNQLFYNFAKSIYPENKITVMGFSIGTGMAAKITQNNRPKQLILQAPYYSLYGVMTDNFLFVPDFLLKYKLETAKYLENSTIPITIFHGGLDETIHYSNSLKIQKKLNQNKNTNLTKQNEEKEKIPIKIKLITLPNQTHMGIENNETYKKQIKQILE